MNPKLEMHRILCEDKIAKIRRKLEVNEQAVKDCKAALKEAESVLKDTEKAIAAWEEEQ